MFDGMESRIAQIVYGIPAVKGLEFGSGFSGSYLRGSQNNDCYVIRDGKVYTERNHAGGILGGITNGMPVIFRTAIKPTPSIFKSQSSISLSRMECAELKLEGRHDPAIIHRARAVVDAMAAIVIADMLTVRYGTDYLASN